MKALSYSSWIVGLSLLAAFALPAQAAKNGGKHADALPGIVAQLDLPQAKQDQADTILSDLQTQIHSIRKDAKASGDMDGARAKIKTARHEAIKKIMAILTPDQKTQFKSLLKEAEAARKAKKAGDATTQPAAQ